VIFSGRNGNTIRALTRQSKARIVIDKTDTGKRMDCLPVTINLSGTFAAIESAKVLVFSRLLLIVVFPVLLWGKWHAVIATFLQVATFRQCYILLTHALPPDQILPQPTTSTHCRRCCYQLADVMWHLDAYDNNSLPMQLQIKWINSVMFWTRVGTRR